MKRLYAFLLLLMLSIISLNVQGRTIYEDEAEEAYLNGDFIRAIELYETYPSDSNQGFRTYTTYFNLGQAYSQIGDWGRALLNYHRAQYFAPRDADIIDRITTVRAIRADWHVEETGILEQLAQFTAFFATWELTFLAMIIWSVSWGIGLRAWLRLKPTPLKTTILITVIIVAVIVTGLTVNRIYIETYRPLAIVIQPQTEVLSGAGIDYFSMFSLYTGAEVRIVKENGIWVKIRLADGREGWVRVNSIAKV